MNGTATVPIDAVLQVEKIDDKILSSEINNKSNSNNESNLYNKLDELQKNIAEGSTNKIDLDLPLDPKDLLDTNKIQSVDFLNCSNTKENLCDENKDSNIEKLVEESFVDEQENNSSIEKLVEESLINENQSNITNTNEIPSNKSDKDIFEIACSELIEGIKSTKPLNANVLEGIDISIDRNQTDPLNEKCDDADLNNTKLLDPVLSNESNSNSENIIAVDSNLCFDKDNNNEDIKVTEAKDDKFESNISLNDNSNIDNSDISQLVNNDIININDDTINIEINKIKSDSDLINEENELVKLKDCEVNLSDSKIKDMDELNDDVFLNKPNFTKIKRKLNEMLASAEDEEADALTFIKRMKKEKLVIYNDILAELQIVKKKFMLA